MLLYSRIIPTVLLGLGPLTAVAEPALEDLHLSIVPRTVRRQGFWNQLLPKLRDRFAHLVGLIMRRVVCDASVAFRASFV